MKSYTLGIVFGIALALSAQAQQFRPGDVIEYKAHGTYPPKWERGVFVRETPSGKQYIIREKPNQFYPEGSQIAYSVDEIRRPGAEAPAAAAPAPTPAPAPARAAASPPARLPAGATISPARSPSSPPP